MFYRALALKGEENVKFDQIKEKTKRASDFQDGIHFVSTLAS